MIKLNIEAADAFELMANLRQIALEMWKLLPPEPVFVPADECVKESPHD